MREADISVIDVETTGFAPSRSDRIVEIGITRIGAQYEVKDRFETLVNPQRDVGPTRIHGITASMVANAPLFRDIAHRLLRFIDGSIIAAHNASFDLRFLCSEFERVGVRFDGFEAICTMRLAKESCLDAPSFKLSALCDYLGIGISDYHSALADSAAAAGLLASIAESRDLHRIRHAKPFAYSVALDYRPDVSLLPRSVYGSSELRREPSKIEILLDRIPSVASADDESLSYSEALDRALRDRVLTDDESTELSHLAESGGLSRDQMKRIHIEYLRYLVRVALIDGMITAIEKTDLERVRALLDVPENVMAQLIEEQRPTVQAIDRHVVGKSVCFTGELQARIGGAPITRECAHRLSAERGLVVKSAVSKSLDYLVVADLATVSTKARKAREYSVQILEETDYWQMVGLQVERG